MKQFQKIMMVSVLALSSATAMAHDTRNISGFYTGVNFGYGFGSAKSTWGVTQSGTGSILGNVSHNSDLGLKGFRGGLMLGYGKLFNKFYAGIELAADLSNTNGKLDDKGGLSSTLQQIAFNVNAKRRESYGIALRLGGMLGSMLTYAKIGVDSAKWKFQASQSNYLAGLAGTTNASKNERLTGLVFGLGMETLLTDHIILGGEWTYTHYRRSSGINVSRKNVAGTETDTMQFKFRPHTSDFRLRVAYKW